MKKVITLTIATLISLTLLGNSDTKPKSKFSYNGYSGGMMLHAGYIFAPGVPELGNYAVSALTTGIGGAIRINFGEHFRFGTEGYSSSANILGNGSYVHSGWGGLLVDVPFTFNKWTVFAGLTAGGGGFKGVYLLEGNAYDWNDEIRTVYRKAGYGMVAPFAGIEYSLTKVINVILKFDYMIPFGKDSFGIPTGPRAYIGSMFNR